MKNYKVNLADVIRAARIGHGLSQEKLAESGTGNPKFENSY